MDTTSCPGPVTAFTRFGGVLPPRYLLGQEFEGGMDRRRFAGEPMLPRTRLGETVEEFRSSSPGPTDHYFSYCPRGFLACVMRAEERHENGELGLRCVLWNVAPSDLGGL